MEWDGTEWLERCALTRYDISTFSMGYDRDDKLVVAMNSATDAHGYIRVARLR